MKGNFPRLDSWVRLTAREESCHHLSLRGQGHTCDPKAWEENHNVKRTIQSFQRTRKYGVNRVLIWCSASLCNCIPSIVKPQMNKGLNTESDANRGLFCYGEWLIECDFPNQFGHVCVDQTRLIFVIRRCVPAGLIWISKVTPVVTAFSASVTAIYRRRIRDFVRPASVYSSTVNAFL